LDLKVKRVEYTSGAYRIKNNELLKKGVTKRVIQQVSSAV
jgi:hypothetical protein